MADALYEALRQDAEKLRQLGREDAASFMVTCDDCGGGGFYSAVPSHGHAYSDPTPGERWDECPTCHGSGWLDNHEPEPEIEQDELPPPRDDK